MRILVYRLGSLGDTVLALPCFHLIRQTYPDAEITVLTNAPVSGKAAPLESILGPSGLIDRVIPYPLGLRSPRRLAELIRQLRAAHFDLVISLAAARGFLASVRDRLFFEACGASRIVGIPVRREDLVCALRADGNLFESEAQRLLRRIAVLGQANLTDPRWLDLKLNQLERDEAARLLASHEVPDRFVAASLGTKTPLNDWGTANWHEFLASLSARHPELGLVLLGSADEATRSEKLLEAWKGPRANLCGSASPRISAAILERAAVFVGHDSGPMHLAAAAGTRCVAIFSARCPPGQWYPAGNGHRPLYPRAFYDPLRTEDLTHQQQALASIRVDQVLKAVEEILGDSP